MRSKWHIGREQEKGDERCQRNDDGLDQVRPKQALEHLRQRSALELQSARECNQGYRQGVDGQQALYGILIDNAECMRTARHAHGDVRRKVRQPHGFEHGRKHGAGEQQIPDSENHVPTLVTEWLSTSNRDGQRRADDQRKYLGKSPPKPRHSHPVVSTERLRGGVASGSVVPSLWPSSLKLERIRRRPTAP